MEAALALGATRWEMIRTAVLPVRPARHDLRGDARPRPRARRDHRGALPSCCPPFGINWHITEPGGNTFAATSRSKFGRGRRRRPRRADRRRPGPVRHHPGRQHRRPARSSTAGGVLRGELMTAADRIRPHRRAAGPAPTRWPAARLPRWAPPGHRRGGRGCVAAAARRGSTESSGWPVPSCRSARCCSSSAPDRLVSFARRGPPAGQEPARDDAGLRRVPRSRSCPLVADLWYTWSARAAERSDVDFLTHSMRNVDPRRAPAAASTTR